MKRTPGPNKHTKAESTANLQISSTLFTQDQENAERTANRLIVRAANIIAKLNKLHALANTNDPDAANDAAALQAELRNIKAEIKQCDLKLGRVIPEENPSFLLPRRH